MSRLVFPFVVTFILALATSGHADTLYGTIGQSNTPGFENSFATIDPQTGAVSATPYGFLFIDGLDFTPDRSILYGVGNSLYTINPAIGAVKTVGPLTLNGDPKVLMTSMTISPTGEMLAVGNSDSTLYAIDPANGHLSVRGVFSTLVRAIEFGPDGTLYGGFAELYKIDPQNAGILADLGSFGRGAGPYVNEMDFSGGVMRGLEIYVGNSPFQARLYNINISAPTGSLAQLVTTIPQNVLSIASVPEPSTLALAALGCLALLAFRRRSAVHSPTRRAT